MGQEDAIMTSCGPGSCVTNSHLHGDLEHTMLTQYNVKKGLKLFSETGMNAIVTEMQPLHDRDMVIPKHANMMT